MRTNIVIDDELLAAAMQLTGIRTKRAVVEEALRVLVRTTEQKGVLELRGKIQWDGDLDELRRGRYIHEPFTEYKAGDSSSLDSSVE